MSKLVKGILIGALASGALVGMWVPINGESMIDKIRNKAKEVKEEV